MSLKWTRSARADLERLYAFLSPVNPNAARRTVVLVNAAAKRIPEFPRLGQRLTEFDPREVRRLVVGEYELRYEIRGTDIVVLRLWHVHEDR